jgi:uncharacterized membrane protein YccC
MKPRVHDPGHVALHRGVRAAIGVPIAMGLALWWLPDTPAALIAGFGVLITVAIADFGGMPSERARAIGGTTLAGLVALTIGVLAGDRLWTAVIASFIVTAVLSFVAVLHGSVASGAPAIMIIYVVSVSLGVPLSSLGPILAGWLIAMALSLPITLFVMPRRTTAPVRAATANALRALADNVRRRAAGEPSDIAALQQAAATLQRSYFGNPFRAAGLSTRNQALQLLAAQVQGLLAAFGREWYSSALVRTPATTRLVAETADNLESIADALETTGAVEPSGMAVASTWEDQWNEAQAMLTNGPAAVRDVNDMFPDRAFGLAAVRTTMLARKTLGLPTEDYSPVIGSHTIPEPIMPSIWRELRSNATLRSPWARLALRTGTGIALAVLVVEIIGLAHGFWVMLGVVSILRFDPLTTLKTGALAITGTFIGAVLGIAIIVADDRNEPLMWAIFIVAVFLATWAPGALGFMLGQAAFSLFVIIAFSLIAWPPELATVEQRVLDICIGVLLSIVIAGLMWPRGLMRGLIGNVADAINVSTALLNGALTALISGPTASTAALPGEANAAVVRARSVVELTLSSSKPAAAGAALQWQALLDHLRTLTVAGRLLANWSYDRPPIDRYAPTLAAPMESECAVVTRTWSHIADEVDGVSSPAEGDTPHDMDDVLTVAEGMDLSTPEVADRALAAIWGHGWLQLSLRAAQATVVPSGK